jgi:glycosyltransferase involved in cell wall biosynthesis
LKRIIVSVTNDLVTDQRVHRVCTTLSNLNYDILLIGRKRKDSFQINKLYNTKRFNLIFNKGFLFYAEYNIRLFILLLFSRKDIFIANDIDTLIPNYIVGKLFNIPLIFDSHELFSEVPELVKRPRVKSFWQKIEDVLIPKIKYKYTVSNSIATYYQNKYNTHFEVIKNIPQISNTKVLNPSNIKLLENAIIYQGALNKGRGLELMIETMKFIENSTFYIVGDGDISEKLKQLVLAQKLSHKVIFLGKIQPEYLPSITTQASLGISFEEDLGLNYRFALPNKLFDYIHANIPVLVSDLPEMRNIVIKYNIGEIIKGRTPIAIANQIKLIIENKNHYQQNFEMVKNELCWENEEKKLKEILIEIDNK